MAWRPIVLQTKLPNQLIRTLCLCLSCGVKLLSTVLWESLVNLQFKFKDSGKPGSNILPYQSNSGLHISILKNPPFKGTFSRDFLIHFFILMTKTVPFVKALIILNFLYKSFVC